MGQKELYNKFQQKWIKAHIIGKLDNGDFTVNVILLNDKNNDLLNCGRIFIKYEKNGKWKIRDFEIDNKIKGQNYGAAMILTAIKFIHQLEKTSPEIEKITQLHGEIGGVYLDDYECGDVKSSNDYYKVTDFYQRLGFKFQDDFAFNKDLNQTTLEQWIIQIEDNIEIRTLKLENAIQREILKNYEKDLDYVKSKWIGKIMLRKLQNKE